MDRYTLLRYLPDYRDEWVIIHNDQDTKDIIKEILQAHKEFARFYDSIALFFDADTVPGICENIYDFLKANVQYREESDERQTTALPAGILTRGYGDCKHYASFSGGVLDALGRVTGRKISWHYCFASYDMFSPTPYHVFVVVDSGKKEIWIDPTPGAEGKTPTWVTNKTVKAAMPLLRNIAGFEDTEDLSSVEDHLNEIPAEQVLPLQLLQSYGVLSPLGELNQARYEFVTAILPGPESQAIKDAAGFLVDQAGAAVVGGWFSDAFKFVQHNAAILGMQVPRAAFLGLVMTNAFHYADKLKRALSYPDTHAKLADLWERVGGKFSKLEEYINKGAGKKPIVSGMGSRVGVEPLTGTAAIIASASVIVAALIPVIMSMLKKHNDPVVNMTPTGANGLPIGYAGGITTFITQNPVVTIGIVAVLGYLAYEYL